MGVKGSLADVVARADALPERKQGGVRRALRSLLSTARTYWPSWTKIKDFLKPRQMVLNAENGDTSKEGTNPEWQGIEVKGKVLRKVAIDPSATVDEVLETMRAVWWRDVSSEYSEWHELLKGQNDQLTPEQRRWMETILPQLKALESVHDVKARSSAASPLLESASLLTFPFKLGMQGKSEAAEYERKQSSAMKVSTVVQEALFGSSQRRFASPLLGAWQLRGTAWTTATVISQTRSGGEASSSKANKRKREEQERLAEEFEKLLSTKGKTALGFADGDEGDEQIELFRASLQRFMRPHGDTEDWVDADDFWDGLGTRRDSNPPLPMSCSQTCSRISTVAAMTLSCASGNDGDGALKVLGKPTSDKYSRGRSPFDFMRATIKTILRRHHMITVPADEDGTLSILRALNQMHGANRAALRDVAIFYKTAKVARTLHSLGKSMPALLDECLCRPLAMLLLQTYVLAHTSLETHELRKQGLWKSSQSKHDGDKMYRQRDATIDVIRYHRTSELSGKLEGIRSKAQAAASTYAAQPRPRVSPAEQRGAVYVEQMASAVEDMLLEVADQSILRLVARAMIDETKDDMPSVRVQRTAFDFIHKRVWDSRTGHSLTLLDAKAMRFTAFAYAAAQHPPTHLRSLCICSERQRSISLCSKRLKQRNYPIDKECAIALMAGHSMLVVASKYRAHISEDGDGPNSRVWLHHDDDETYVSNTRAIVFAMANASAASQLSGGPSFALGRFGISGFAFTTAQSGNNMSLAGRQDESGTDLDFLGTMWKARKHFTERPTARQVLEVLAANTAAGGGLVTQCSLKYYEPSGLFSNVLEPYNTGGKGSHEALLFVATLLGLPAPTRRQVEPILSALKRRLETKDATGDRRFAALLRKRARAHPVLRDVEDLCALIGSTLLTGGTLETFLVRLHRSNPLDGEPIQG
jgi:hypothetical protein